LIKTDILIIGSGAAGMTAAIEKGVFGVPTIIIDDNLFWGNDQMDHIELLLDGKDPLDRERLNDQERPRAIDRKAFKKQDKE